MNSTILITGGAGFIGSHLSRELLRANYRVRVLDNLDPQVHPDRARPGYLDSEVELMIGDVADGEAVTRALEGVDMVCHLAAKVGVGQSMYEIVRYTQVNEIGTAVLLEKLAETSMLCELFQIFNDWPCISLVPAATSLAVSNPEGCPQDMVQTASLVAAASLVVTVDTMVAHLAGALGRPVWLLLHQDPDWRWRMAGARSPWYPTMRIYRQSRQGDWAAPMAQIREDLRACHGDYL